MLEAGVDQFAFGDDFALAVFVVVRNPQGIADPAPVVGRVPVPALSDGPDGDQPDGVRFRLAFDGSDDVPGSADVDRVRQFGVVIGKRGDYRASVQDKVCPGHAGEHGGGSP